MPSYDNKQQENEQQENKRIHKAIKNDDGETFKKYLDEHRVNLDIARPHKAHALFAKRLGLVIYAFENNKPKILDLLLKSEEFSNQVGNIESWLAEKGGYCDFYCTLFKESRYDPSTEVLKVLSKNFAQHLNKPGYARFTFDQKYLIKYIETKLDYFDQLAAQYYKLVEGTSVNNNSGINAGTINTGTIIEHLENGNNTMVNFYIDKANEDIINKLYMGQSPLHIAIVNENVDAVKSILAIPGVDLNIKNKQEKTPLELIEAGNPQGKSHAALNHIKWLLKEAADNVTKNSPTKPKI